MKYIKTENGYDFYSEICDYSHEDFFNLVPAGAPKPEGGYRSAKYILSIKGIANVRTEQEAKTYFKTEEI